jgi:hypothetical protein
MNEDDNSTDPKVGSAGKSKPFEKKSVGAYHTFLGTQTVRATKSATRILNVRLHITELKPKTEPEKT